MGIESQYLGEINIPEEHRAEYAQQALKLLRAGGIIKMAGHWKGLRNS